LSAGACAACAGAADKNRYTPIPRRQDFRAAWREHGAVFNPASTEYRMKLSIKPWARRSLIALAGAALLFGGLAACSHHPHHGTMTEADINQFRDRVIDKAGRELSLDAAQKAKLALLAEALKAQRTALIAGSDNPRAELQALVAGPQFDRARAQALVDAKTGALRDKAPAVVGAMADFYDSLQPEQQQKLRELMDKRRGWRS
jgi:Spy/CpxP family protein refolding chaperone